MLATRQPQGEITELLQRWQGGEAAALDELAPRVYGELRQLARRYLQREHSPSSLETHDLIHEAFLRLVGQNRTSWQNRAHFFALAAGMMRRILVDRARRHRYAKHGGALRRVELNEEIAHPPPASVDLEELDLALTELAGEDPGLARLVELRFFGGLEHQEVAAVLGVSEPTVRRRWRTARAWLYERLYPQSLLDARRGSA
ncbi:MAG TPA: ECF-type sigma factor [Thermoanaerobaculia bacterium]|nr:ECF-type sigma factor [Thermoanaerobaculia bacterium]